LNMWSYRVFLPIFQLRLDFFEWLDRNSRCKPRPTPEAGVPGSRTESLTAYVTLGGQIGEQLAPTQLQRAHVNFAFPEGGFNIRASPSLSSPARQTTASKNLSNLGGTVSIVPLPKQFMCLFLLPIESFQLRPPKTLTLSVHA
jgi:hypothetical protein